MNLSGVISSECGISYSSKSKYYINYGKVSQRIENYPDTEFHSATVIIDEEGNHTNYSTKLEETLNESDIIYSNESSIIYSSNNLSKKGSIHVSNRIINKITNNITISTNQSIPKVIVKEINLSEEIPNITIVINTSEELDYRLLIYTFLGSLLIGIIFGIIIRLMRIV